MRRYLLCFYDDPAVLERLGPEEVSQLIQECVEWAAEASARARAVTGGRIDSQPVAVIGGGRSQPLGTSPGQEGAGGLSAVFLLDEWDLKEALAWCRGFPHLRYGGTIEIREVPEAAGALLESGLG